MAPVTTGSVPCGVFHRVSFTIRTVYGWGAIGEDEGNGGRERKRERECMYMARHGDRVGRAATLLGRFKILFSDCASSIFRARSSEAQPSFHLHDTVRAVENGKRYESANRGKREVQKEKKKRCFTRITLIRRSRGNGGEGGEKWMSRMEKSVGTGLRETGSVSQAVAAHRD